MVFGGIVVSFDGHLVSLRNELQCTSKCPEVLIRSRLIRVVTSGKGFRDTGEDSDDDCDYRRSDVSLFPPKHESV